MSNTLLGTALSGLAAFQRSLATTSHNIANVNTEGYSRQRTELASNPAQLVSSGYLGKGVNVGNITRVYDQFTNTQLRSSTATFAEVDKYHALSAQIDNMLADEATGMTPVLNSFFNAVGEVANDPSSMPARQVMISETELLAQKFNNIAGRFDRLRIQLNSDLGFSVEKINSLSTGIADLNLNIVVDIGRTSGDQQPNDLIDQRDSLLSQLAEIIDVSVLQQSDGSVSVFIGMGQSLVLGASVTSLSLENSALDLFHKEIHMQGQDISGQLSGGEMTGMLRFRDEVLDPAQQQGVLAAGLAVEFNELHKSGFDLNATAGTDVFAFGSPEIPVVTFVSAGDTITATFKASAANLQATDYQIDILAPGTVGGSITLPTFSITNLSDGSVVLPADVGFDLAFSGTMATGDQFVIRPTFLAAKNISSEITDPRAIAASQTVNTLPGDNRIALELADLKTKSKLLGGTTTFSQSYEQLVADVGTKTHSASINRAAQEALFNQAKEARENGSGVNLDEEAANLIKFQNAYQAAAQAVSVSRSIFDTLIGAVR